MVQSSFYNDDYFSRNPADETDLFDVNFDGTDTPEDIDLREKFVLSKSGTQEQRFKEMINMSMTNAFTNLRIVLFEIYILYLLQVGEGVGWS